MLQISVEVTISVLYNSVLKLHDLLDSSVIGSLGLVIELYFVEFISFTTVFKLWLEVDFT
jgi:hypothetical protein